MDLVASCRDKLAYFRIKELKDVLTQLGLAKQGKKQDLVDRILALLLDDQVPKTQIWGRRNFIGKERVAKIIDDTYRKMQVPGAADLASKSHSGSEFSHVKPKEEVDSYKPETKVRCPCGKSLNSESIIQCEDHRCRVWQHIACVIIPEKPMEGASPEVPSHFYCEICRINRADPFWATIKHLLLPVKLSPCGIKADGTNTVQNEERTFQLSKTERELLQRPDYGLQVWCLLFNDKVPFRMQWPQFAELQVNGVSVRVVTRPGSQLLGINGRDDGPVITTCSKEGINKIVLSRCDARIFCFGIRLAKRRTVPQVLSLVPKEAEGERFQDALARVCRCIGGGADTENADSDSDLEVVADSVTVNLRCPMSGSRMRIAGRFKPCVHMGCFDLETFVELNRRSRKWQCPICLKNYSLENIIIDPYFNRITSMLQNCGEDVTEIDVKPDGSWRVKNEVESLDLSKWHLPDGTLCDITDVVKLDLGELRHMNQRSPSERHLGLNLGMKLNSNGRPEDNKLQSSGSPILGRLENHSQNIINMSSSATGSYRDGEDPSVNQEVGGPFDLSLNNGHEFDSFSLSLDRTYSVEDRTPAPLKGPDVILLSDSDEDNLTPISPETAYDIHPAGNDTIPFPNHPGVSERYSENAGPETNGSSFLGLFNNTDDFGMPIWPMQTCSQSGPAFQLFGTEVLDVLADSHSSLGCAPINGYGLTPNNGAEDASRVQDLSNCHSGTGMQESLVDNPLAFANDDPSLQIFLPSQPVGVALQDDLIDGTDIPNGINSDDWISLRLTAGGGHGDSAPSHGLTSRQQVTIKETRMDILDDAASLLLSMNSNEANKANSKNQRSDSSPGQPRSVRPRLYLSIDTDSD